MVVEEDDLIRQLVEQWLQGAGYLVKSMERGPLNNEPADLIVANVASVRAAAAVVRALKAAHGAPLLLLSARFGRAETASMRLAQQLGVAGVLPKPFTRQELLTSVQRILRRG